MRKYPAYTVDSLLDEYAIRYCVLLKYAYMHDASDRLQEIRIANMPHYKDRKAADRIISEYQKQASGIRDKPVDPNKPFKSQLRKKPA